VGDVTRVCLLTGASGAFGTAFVERYADRYQIVAVHHRTPIRYATQEQAFIDPLAPSTRITENDQAVHGVRADLSEQSEIDRVVEEALEGFGRVDLLVNAAVHRRWSSILAPAAAADAGRVIDINLLAPLRLAVRLARDFWGRDPADNVSANRNIVNISSTAGLFVYPDLGQALYATSKAALNHLTYHLASELWDLGVRVNALAPDTFPGRIPIEDVLDAVLELDMSDATGEVVPLIAAAA
jgi:NAD(P)-dependent dehydrogenase (short-subunit alcohol dehydrogenase family)